MAVGDDEMIDTSFAPNHTTSCFPFFFLSRPKKDDGESHLHTATTRHAHFLHHHHQFRF